MENQNWNPGHSLNHGYPYNGVESKRTMKNRPTLTHNEEEKIIIDWDAQVFGYIPDDYTRRTELEDFLLHRLYDFQETLAIAEGQVQDILEEKPFLPENYGFEVVHKNMDITQSPVRIYQSIYDERYSLFRKPNDGSSDFNPSSWTLLSKNEDQTFKEVDILLPCDRIAYAIFYGLGVRVTRPDGKESVTRPAKEDKPVKKENEYNVNVRRIDERACVDIDHTIIVVAQNESDALTKGKFHLETDPSIGYMLQDIKPEELSIVH